MGAEKRKNLGEISWKKPSDTHALGKNPLPRKASLRLESIPKKVDPNPFLIKLRCNLLITHDLKQGSECKFIKVKEL